MTKPNWEQLLAAISNGDKEAYDFIIAWQNHSHIVDDIIDGEIVNKSLIVKAFVNAQGLVQMPFFQKYNQVLWAQLILAANAYVDHLEIGAEISGKDYKKLISDSLRSYPNEMLILVAMLTSKEDEVPWDRARKISLQLRELSYIEHHDSEGNPI